MLPDETGACRRRKDFRHATRRALRGRTRSARLSFALITGIMISTISGASPTVSGALDPANHHGRVLIVDFWASWCKPCRQSIPWLNAMRSRYAASGLDIVGVNVDAERGDAEKFLRDVPIDFEVVFDPDGKLASQFKLQGMPSSFVFDRSGKLVETHLGFRDAKKDQNEAALKNLLNSRVQ